MQRPIVFLSPKPLIGLPGDVTHIPGLCSGDGLTYFDTSSGTTTPGDLYTVSPTAEVKHVLRKLPVGFTDVSVKSFFASEHTMATLLEADQRDSPDLRPRSTEYLLSTSDHDGDGADLLTLNLHFKPLRIGAFGSGDFVVLGWDTANQLPLLAMLKPDGTIRRFLTLGDLESPDASAATNAELLEKAAFVPFGDSLFLTFPGTTHVLLRLSASGDTSPLTLSIPSGFVLHDVLGTDARTTLVARVQAPAGRNEEKPAPPPIQRLLEFSAYTGALQREFLLGDVPVTAVTCSAKQSLTAVWLNPKGDSVKTSTPEGTPAPDPPKELVISTVRR